MWATGMRIHKVKLYAWPIRVVSVGLLCLTLVACAGRTASKVPDESQASTEAALVNGADADIDLSSNSTATDDPQTIPQTTPEAIPQTAPEDIPTESLAEPLAAALAETPPDQQAAVIVLIPPATTTGPVAPPEPTARDRKKAEKRAKADINHPDDDQTDAEVMAANETGPPASLGPPADPCRQYDAEYPSWIDRNHVMVYRTVCGAAAWFDGFFGDNRYDPQTGNTYGRIGTGVYWDQQEGWNTRLRFRAKFALPSVRRRGSLLIGRGDEEELIQERGEAGSTPIQETLAGEQDSTFVGYGFDRLNSLTRGLRFSVGLRISAPVRVYGKIKYRRVWQLTDRDLFRLRPVLYWKSEEGVGGTMAFDIDHIISQTMLLRSANFANASQDEEVEGINWGSNLYLYQFLSNKRAVTYSAYVSGETKAEVGLQNIGVEFRYRHRFLRDWLFLEYITGLNWPREFLDEPRDANWGAGIVLEAYFGPAPESWVR
jgi:hypothetical protein